MLCYLRLLRNRYDDFALLGVLASPLVGISNDGLLALRRGAVRRPIFTALERDELPEGLSADEQRLVAAFKQRLARLSTRLGEVGLERLIDLVVAEHDYDLACLAQPDGDRRLANVVKLARLAGSYEALRGPDLEGFIGFCDEQSGTGDPRGRGGDRRGGRAGGRADDHPRRQGPRVRRGGAGRHRPRADRAPGRRHPGRRRAAGSRCARPTRSTGRCRRALGWGEVAAAEAAAQAEEGRRLQYVALTRARRHLIVSGALDPGEDTTIGQICGTLGIGARRRGRSRRRAAPGCGCASAGPAREDAAEPEPVHAEQPEIGGQLELFSVGGRSVIAARRARAGARGGCGRPAPALLQRARALSPLRLPLLRPARAGAARAVHASRGEGGGLDALELGDAVHLELERPDGRWRARYPEATRRERRADRPAWSATGAGRSSPRASAGSPTSRASSRSPSTSTACCSTAASTSTPAPEPGVGARDRLQDQPPRRALGRGGGRRVLRRAGGHLRAGRAARRRRAGRGRLRVPREHGDRPRPGRSPPRTPRGSRPSCAPTSRRSARASFPPGPGSSAASARRSTCCVPASAWSGASERAARRVRSRSSIGSRPTHPDAHIALRFGSPARPAGGDDPLGPVHGRAREHGHRRALPPLPHRRGLPRTSASGSSRS